VLVACAALAAGACGDAENVQVQPLPPLQRPSPEARAGLPEVRGVWRFAGFEIPARDTTLVREKVYALTPLGDFQIGTQRLDSIAGRYVRGQVTFPFTGEVRRDSVLAIVAFSGGVGQFLSGRVLKDTLWVEMTSFSSAVESWPRGTRAALVRSRTPVTNPFRRLLGGAPINAPVDSVALDSVRLDSLRRAGVLPPAAAPGTVPPGTGVPQPGVPQPGTVPQSGVPQTGVPQTGVPQTQPAAPRPTAPQTQPRPAQPVQPRPAAPRPQPRPPVQQTPPVQQQPPVYEPPVSQPPAAQPPVPQPAAPRDTIRFPR
jgi:hypothetical protein